MTDLIYLIIETNNLPSLLKKKHGNSPEITAFMLVEALLSTKSAAEAASLLNISEQTKNRIFNKYFRPVLGKLQGGNETWKYTILKSVQHKECFTCCTIKPYSKFGLDRHNSDGRNTRCKYCRSFDNASLYQARKLRIPSWFEQEKEKIAEFYDNCPEGCHVDHIIPLQGKLVSGLHTLSNLQYLPADENIKKGNKYAGDW